MNDTLKVQTLGSVLVIGTFVAAEAAAHLLAAYPNSPTAWYLNIELFRLFEHARSGGSPLYHLYGPATLWVGLLTLIATIVVGVLRVRLAIGIIANVCFVLTAGLSAALYLRTSSYKAASLTPVSLTDEQDLYLLTLITAVAFVAFVASHFSFLRAIRLEKGTGLDKTGMKNLTAM